jgi:1,4-alpha-glucan branching enzyme
VVCNFTQVVRENYRIGLPQNGKLEEIFNSDAEVYGGSGVENNTSLDIQTVPHDGREYSVVILLPPLSVTVYKFV